jgi:hypothetical protein
VTDHDSNVHPSSARILSTNPTFIASVHRYDGSGWTVLQALGIIEMGSSILWIPHPNNPETEYGAIAVPLTDQTTAQAVLYATRRFIPPYPMYDSKGSCPDQSRFYDVAALAFASRRTHDRSLVQLEVIGAVVTMSVRPSFVNLLAQSM